MNIAFLKRVLKLESTEEKISRYRELLIEQGDLLKSLDLLSEEYIFNKRNYDAAINSELNKPILDKIIGKFDDFNKGYQKTLGGVKTSLDLVKVELLKIESDSKISEAIKIEKAYFDSKKVYHKEVLPLDNLNTIIKAITGDKKVKYADNIVLNQKGQLLILKRSIWEDTHKGAWVIPGGHVDPGESFEQAAVRELREESGFNVKSAKEIGKFTNKEVEIHYFISYVDTTEQPSIIDMVEVRDLKWIDLSELDEFEMVFNMKSNIKNILNIKESPIKVISKAIKAGKLPTKEEIEKAKQTPTQSAKIAEVMSEFKEGKLKSSSGKKVISRDQAIAIAMSEAGLSKSGDEPESDYISEEHLKEMIIEHERLIKVLGSIKNPSERVKKELQIQKQELKEYKGQLTSTEKGVCKPTPIEKGENNELKFFKKFNEYLTDKDGFNFYKNRYKLGKLNGFPKGLDLENCEIVALYNDKAIIECGGDCQKPANVTIGLKGNDLQVVSVFENNDQHKDEMKKNLKILYGINK